MATHLEKLKEAKTEAEYEAQLFEFMVDLNADDSHTLNISEWLHKQENVKKTAMLGLMMLGELMGKALKDFSDDDDELSRFHWERDDD